MKVLDFTRTENAQVYEILYDGLLNSTRGFEAPSETRVLSHIQDKFERIGLTAERGGVKTFTLAPPSGMVTLEEVEYQLMAEALKAVRWTSKAAKAATMALDFFTNAPSEAPVDAAK